MHVDVFVTQVDGKVEKTVYFIILESCDQDALSTLCVSKHTLNQFKLDFPNTKKLSKLTMQDAILVMSVLRAVTSWQRK